VLLAHGTRDRVVPISDMRLIEQNARPQHTVQVLAIEDAHHNSVDDFKRHSKDLIAFIHAHLGRNDDPLA
jgi:predicted esterase